MVSGGGSRFFEMSSSSKPLSSCWARHLSSRMGKSGFEFSLGVEVKAAEVKADLRIGVRDERGSY